VRDAGQQQEQKDEVPVSEALLKKRLRENARNQKVREAGGPKLYREQQQEQKDAAKMAKAAAEAKVKAEAAAKKVEEHVLKMVIFPG
jgi:hypothetical protein